MKDGVREIPGKTISAVVVGSANRPPRNQVILVFDDGTSIEFYGDAFTCTSGLDYHNLDKAIAYVEEMGGVDAVYTEEGD